MGEAGIETGAIVDVIEAVGEIRSDLNSGNPGGKNCKAWVFRVSETIC